MPYRTQSPDASVQAERVQIEVLRHATLARRFDVARALTETGAQLAWRAIRRAHPQLSDDEVHLRFVAIQHGQSLADGLRAYLARRRGDRA